MITLRIEHAVPDFDGWKRLFDADPVDRKGSGVRHYRVGRWSDGATHVVIDLDFDDADSAEAMHAKLRALWAGPAKDVTVEPTARVVELVDEASI